MFDGIGTDAIEKYDIVESAKSRALVPYVPSCLEIIIACPRALVP